MLQTIRDHTQGWIAGTIISIIILTFALWGIHSYFVGGSANTNVAEVNGVAISKEQLAVAYERLRRNVQMQYGANNPVTAKDEANLKNRALQKLIDDEVLKQSSVDQGFRVSDRQIDNYLQGIPDFQVDGRFSLDRFQEFLSSTLLSTSEFLDLIKANLLISQPKLGIIFTSFAMPDEITYTIGLVNQERDVDYLIIPMQNFLSQPIKIPPEKINAYYEQHRNDFMTPEQVNVEYLELSLKDLEAKITPTDTMLKSFYNENINSYTQPMQWKLSYMEIPLSNTASQDDVAAVMKKADTAEQSLKNGEDFSKVADSVSANVTNEGWMSLNQVPEELQKAVSSLNKQGQLSEPFRTSKGVAIVKIVGIQEPKMQSFDVVKDKVKEAYVHQHAEEKLADLRDKLADMTYEHPDSLGYAAKNLGLTIQTSELFTKDKGGKDISQYKKVRETAFSNDVLNLQNNSDVVQINPETMVVLRVKSHVASSLLPLSAVSGQIEEKLKTQEAETEADRFAEDLQKKLQAGGDPGSLASTAKLAWQHTGMIGRYSIKVDSAILDLAFRLPNPATMQNKIMYGVTRVPSGYAVVALKSVKDGTVADKKQYTVFAEQIQNSDGALEYELYKQSQMQKAKVTTQS